LISALTFFFVLYSYNSRFPFTFIGHKSIIHNTITYSWVWNWQNI